MLTVTPRVAPIIGGRLGKQTCLPLHHAWPLSLVAGKESRHAYRYTTRGPYHWWQARKADMLSVTPRVAPIISGRLGKQTCLPLHHAWPPRHTTKAATLGGSVTSAMQIKPQIYTRAVTCSVGASPTGSYDYACCPKMDMNLFSCLFMQELDHVELPNDMLTHKWDPPPRNESYYAKPTFAVARNLLWRCKKLTLRFWL